MEKSMAPHSSTLAWKIPWTEETGRLQTMHGVAMSPTWLSDFTFTFHFHALEKEMATHSSVLAWRIPGIAEPGGLPSVGSHRVGQDWSDLQQQQQQWLYNIQVKTSRGVLFLPPSDACVRSFIYLLYTLIKLYYTHRHRHTHTHTHTHKGDFQTTSWLTKIWCQSIEATKRSWKTFSWEFPGSPVVRTLSFHCYGPRLNTWSGN